MAVNYDLYHKIDKLEKWVWRHNAINESSHDDKYIKLKNRDGLVKNYLIADYSSIEELAAVIAEDFGFENDWGQARGSKRGKYYFFNMANEWEDTIIGNLTNDGYQEVEGPEDAEKTTMRYAYDGISDWIADVGDDDPDFDAPSFVRKATNDGHAEYTFHREDDDDYTLKLTVVDDPSEYEYFE